MTPVLRAFRVLIAVSILLSSCSLWRTNAAESSNRGREALRSGDYAKAREYFEGALKSSPKQEESQIGLLEVLRETGAYQEAEKRADAFLTANESSGPLQFQRGRIGAARGDYSGAEKHLRRAVAIGGAARLDAMIELGDLLERLGRRTDAESLWGQVIAEYRNGRVHGSHDLGNVAVAAWRRGFIQDAKNLFLDATERSGEASLEALSNFGYLFLEKYNATDAMGVFKDCLKINKAYPPALVGMALAKEYESSADVEAYARAALAVNPNMIAALNLLAQVSMEEEDYDGALEQVQSSLAVNPSDLDSLSLQAVCYQFRGDAAGFRVVEKKVLAINPSYGRLYYTIAEHLVTRRKYQEAVESNRKAIALDPQLWPSYASLGMNLTRIGDLDAGRKAIQQAFEGDAFNIWAYNTLELLDQMDSFKRSTSEHFIFRMSPEDAPVLAPYAPKLAEEVYAKLAARYGFSPKGPIQVEFFPDHGGFAVRTLGLPGLGALGVCFGKVIALDSPRARKAGTFNWGSTLWHEFTHVITLEMTNHNIPRWYSEGLSVFEEHKARPGWGDGVSAPFLKAYKEGKLLKVSELNAGMMRPKEPEQIAFSYVQAALFCELIEQKFGFDKIKQTLNLFARNKSVELVFKEALGWDMATVDREYGNYLDSRFKNMASHLNFSRVAAHELGHGGEAEASPDKKALAAALEKDPDDFFANLRMGGLLRKEAANREAEPYLKRAQKVFPDFVEPGSPYEVLGDIYLEQKREDDALAVFLEWSRHADSVTAPLVRAADAYRNRKEWKSAANSLEMTIYVNPYDQSVHAMLADAATEAKDWPAAIAACQALVGLNPTDPAGAHYALAKALFGAGKVQDAKRETLRALEIAPSYEKAQELLLKIAGGKP